MDTRKLRRPIAAVVAAVALAGGTYGIVSATAGNGHSAAATTTTVPFAGRGGGARSAPSEGGTVGIVSSVSKSGFILATPAGQKVTVRTTSAPNYRVGTTVLVTGVANGTTLAARQVVAHAAVSSASVVPFQRGARSASKQVGEIPASYTQGVGTIVSGTTADKATTAALASYPGGIVDRVVKLSNGEYEVHNIGVNWPHHIFVDASFKVVGAN
jgi:hypothetical protein